MGNIDAAIIRALGNTLEAIEIIQQSHGSGFRIIVHMRTRHDSPVVETCARRFMTLAEAENYAELEFGDVTLSFKLETA